MAMTMMKVWASKVALYALCLGVLAGCGKGPGTTQEIAAEVTESVATPGNEKPVEGREPQVAPAAILTAIAGLQLGDEVNLPPNLDFSEYVPQRERGQWFLYGVQSFNLKADGVASPVGYLLQAKDVSHVDAAGTQRISQSSRSPVDTSKIVIFKTEEYRRSIDQIRGPSYARTAQPKLASSTETVPLNPPELLVTAQRTEYETDGGNRTVTVQPVGLSTVTVAGHVYQGALHMETTWQQHDAEKTTLVTHSWWVPKLGLVAKVASPGGQQGGFYMASTLLRTGHSHGNEAALIRSIDALLPALPGGFGAESDATKQRLLELSETGTSAPPLSVATTTPKARCLAGDGGACLAWGTAAESTDSIPESALAYRKACDLGNLQGCHLLGRCYSDGLGVDEDKKEALRLFGDACRGGYKEGCTSFAFLGLTHNPSNSDQQTEVAWKLLKKTCREGEQRACAIQRVYEANMRK